MSIIAEYGTVLLGLGCLFGFFMAWGVGANDVANAMGTSVGSRALTIKQAICIAIFLNSPELIWQVVRLQIQYAKGLLIRMYRFWSTAPIFWCLE